MSIIEYLVIVYGGELAKDVAERVVAKKPAASSIQVTLRCADDRPKTLADLGADTVVCFVLQTIENASPTEDVRLCLLWLLLRVLSRSTALHHSHIYPISLFFRVGRVSDSSSERHTPKHSFPTSFRIQFWVWGIRTYCWIGKRLERTTAIKWHKHSMRALTLSVGSATTVWASSTSDRG
jgi:hypothetical protein